MADVLIRDIRMPKEHCWECVLMRQMTCPLTLRMIPQTGKLDDCPLVELPPHGDLIDRDKTIVRVTNLANRIGDEVGIECACSYMLIAMWLPNKEEFPTVIPADKEKA